MAGVAAAAIGASSLVGFAGSQMAAGKTADAMNGANAINQEMFNYQKAQEKPYQEAGVKALGGMQDPRFQHDFSMSDFNTSPGYQFSLQQGQNALNAANAASGNSVSGAGLAALSNYNVGSANQEYQQAFNNYQNQQNNQFGRLSTLAAGGAGANAAMGNAANALAGRSGSNMMTSGNAAAGAMMAGTNAIGQGIQGYANYANTQNPGAPPGSGFSTMSDFANSSGSNLQEPSLYTPSAPSGGYSLGD